MYTCEIAHVPATTSLTIPLLHAMNLWYVNTSRGNNELLWRRVQEKDVITVLLRHLALPQSLLSAYVTKQTLVCLLISLPSLHSPRTNDDADEIIDDDDGHIQGWEWTAVLIRALDSLLQPLSLPRQHVPAAASTASTEVMHAPSTRDAPDSSSPASAIMQETIASQSLASMARYHYDVFSILLSLLTHDHRNHDSSNSNSNYNNSSNSNGSSSSREK